MEVRRPEAMAMDAVILSRLEPPVTTTSTHHVVIETTSSQRLRREAHAKIPLAERPSDDPVPGRTTNSSRCQCDWPPPLARPESAPPLVDQCPATIWP